MQARDFFMPVGHAVNFLSSIGVIPSETAVLLNRLNLYVDDFIESDRRGLFTTSYWIVAQKRPVCTRVVQYAACMTLVPAHKRTNHAVPRPKFGDALSAVPDGPLDNFPLIWPCRTQ